MEFKDLPLDTALQMLKPEGALNILQDPDNLSAPHNVSYHLLAGFLPPRKSEWLWDPGLGRALGLCSLSRRWSWVTGAAPGWEMHIELLDRYAKSNSRALGRSSGQPRVHLCQNQ